jgi:acyl-CoA thioesterase-2
MLDLKSLLDNLHVEQLDKYLFRGGAVHIGTTRVFGGQVLAQSLNAAFRSVPEERKPHSLHGYFLRPGDLSRQIIYEVDPIRDGRSFSTRRVVAKQNGEAIFNCSISFHKDEDGLEHQMDMPDGIPMPEDLPSDEDYAEQLAKTKPEISVEKYKSIFLLPGKHIVDIRSAFPLTTLEPQVETPSHGYWFKFHKDIGDDPIVHRTLLAFISDKGLLSTGLRPHPVSWLTHKIIGASLDHAMWFHGDIRVDQWIYYHMDSPKAARARDFNRGSFYTHDGQLIASSAQEGLIRLVGGEK